MKIDQQPELEYLEAEQPKTDKQQQDGMHHEPYQLRISIANNANYTQYYQQGRLDYSQEPKTEQAACLTDQKQAAGNQKQMCTTIEDYDPRGSAKNTINCRCVLGYDTIEQ